MASPKFHINPASGRTGACTARLQCPFGGEEAHYASEAEARAAYESTQSSFGPVTLLQAVETPKNSYLDSDGAREMWARGVVVNHIDSPPHFNLKKPLGSRMGFMAGKYYDHGPGGGWRSASFTPDGKIAFVDVNRSFSGRAELAAKRWDEDTQEWQDIYTPKGGHEYDVSHVLGQYGYKRTTTGMIAAKDVRRMRKELSAIGSERPSSGENDPAWSNAIRPGKLDKPAHVVAAESKAKVEDIMYNLSAYPDDLEGSVPDPENYRFVAQQFYDDFEDGPSQDMKALQVQAEEWLNSKDNHEAHIGYYVLEEVKRKNA